MAEYNTHTDQNLLALLKEGVQPAYAEIYERYERLLYIHAYKRLRNREEARDVVQDVFTTIWNKRHMLEPGSSLRAYLYTAVRNRIFNLIARQKLESDYVDSLAEFLDQQTTETDYTARYNQMFALIEKEVSQLPPKMREVFELSRNEQLSHREIAIQLNLAEETVKKQVHNALKILKVKLGPLYSLVLM